MFCPKTLLNYYFIEERFFDIYFNLQGAGWQYVVRNVSSNYSVWCFWMTTILNHISHDSKILVIHFYSFFKNHFFGFKILIFKSHVYFFQGLVTRRVDECLQKCVRYGNSCPTIITQCFRKSTYTKSRPHSWIKCVYSVIFPPKVGSR